jgi:hypothetical protein
VYWASDSAQTIGVADLDGTNVNLDLVTGANSPAGIAVYVASAPPTTTTTTVAPTTTTTATNGDPIAPAFTG